jgi:hypothetical protein
LQRNCLLEKFRDAGLGSFAESADRPGFADVYKL